MAKRQNFVVGSTNLVTQSMTTDELNHGFDQYEILTADELDGVFNAVSDYSNDSSNEIANAIQSITGAQPTGSSENELANALQQMRNEIETTSLTFKGYVATSAPSSSTYTLVEGNLWINSATMPTSFPVAASSIKQWNGTSWVNYGSTYTPADFDFFRNINDNEGYYWFGGLWTVMSTDMSTTYFTLNQSTGKWEIKSSVNLLGSPTTTTPDAADQSTKIATTQFAHDFGQRYVSNCITEIPQDINLTFSSGTLTLKSGSKVYTPNGAGVFDESTITADITTALAPIGATGQYMLFFVSGNTSLSIMSPVSECYSGSSSFSGTGTYYNTTDNTIDYYNGGASGIRFSFPLGIVTVTDGVITGIDQVFNGFGYIGSTVFTLPGVKGLIPNGRNADGTLKNTAFTISSVKTQTSSTVGNNMILRMYSNGSMFWSTANVYYDPTTNYTIAGGAKDTAACVCTLSTTTGGSITSFTTKQAFHAVDYSILELIYPVGSIYIGTQATCPLTTIIPGSAWLLVATKIVVNNPNNVPVVGTGMTLGLTNGTKNVGLATRSGQGDGNQHFPNGNAYGISVTATGPSDSDTYGAFGVTTDPEKSGMVADMSSVATITTNVWRRTA